jgi:predicted flap endonuclease-1-like 5' DNA nuclease
MSHKISDIEGIGPAYEAKLKEIGIGSVEQLLEKGASAKGREEIESQTGIDHKRVLDWVGMADLFRVKGIASQFAELLKGAGVDTVKELRTRNAANLQKKMEEVNEEKKLTRSVPSLGQVEDWVGQAKEMEPVVTY